MERLRSIDGLPVMETLGPSRLRRVVGVSAAAVGLVVASASSGLAHVNPSPSQVKPGSVATVSFVIGHGCGTSPTTSVAIRVPANVTKVAGVAPKGWTSSVSGSVVSFTGGSLPDKTKGSFGVTFTAPTTLGTLVFPTVQTCAKGKNSWIQAPVANGTEPESPAPTVLVTNTPRAKKPTVQKH